jgi:hypothetical protein
MRILITLPHYFGPNGNGRHGSLRPDREPRIEALARCLATLRDQCDRSAVLLDIARREARPIAPSQRHELDIVVCATRGRHLLDRLALPPGYFHHHATQAHDAGDPVQRLRKRTASSARFVRRGPPVPREATRVRASAAALDAIVASQASEHSGDLP